MSNTSGASVCIRYAVSIELMVGFAGGFSSAALFLAFAYTQGFRLILYTVVVAIGILVGLEIPLLMRILKDRLEFRELVAHVLTFDYLGALAASLRVECDSIRMRRPCFCATLIHGSIRLTAATVPWRSASSRLIIVISFPRSLCRTSSMKVRMRSRPRPLVESRLGVAFGS